MKLALLLFIGLFAGVYGCIIGAGGGFILMPALLLMHPFEQPSSLTATSLIAVFVNSLSGSIAYARAKRIRYRYVGALIAGMLPGSVIGAMLSRIVERSLFNLAFGVLLIALSAYLLLKSGKQPHANTMGGYYENRSRDELAHECGGIRCDTWSGFFIIALLGCAVATVGIFAGVGGGIMLVPILVGLVGMPTHIATATSMAAVCANSLIGVLTHFASGTAFNIFEAVVIGVGVTAGAQIGAALSGRISSEWILRLLAGALGIVGVRILLTAALVLSP